MNKKIWLTLIAIFVVASMALGACGGAATEAPTVEETDAPAVEETEEMMEEVMEETEEVAVSDTGSALEDTYADVDPTGQTISFWHQHSTSREEALEAIVQEFNETNEWGITVEAEYQGGYGDIFNKMLTFMNTDDVPNLVVAYQNQAATYQLADALIDMDYLVYSSKWGLDETEREDFFPGFFYQDVFPTFGNARLGFPPNRSMEVLYYNMDWLTELGYDAPPTTPAEFEEMACAAVEQPYSGSLVDASVGYKLSIDASRYASWTFAFGGDVFNYDTGEYTYDSEAAVEAMSFLQGLFDKGCAELVTESYGDQTDFGQGALLFTVGSSSGLPYYDSAVNDGGAGFEWSVAPIPHTTDEPVQNIYGASVSIPRSTPEGELAAWLFVKYYTDAEHQAAWTEASNYFPVRASVADKLEESGYFAANPTFKTAFDMLKYGVGEPPTPGYDFVRTMSEEAMAAIADGADVAATTASLNADANESLAEQLAQIPESPDPWAKVDPSGQTVLFWHQHTSPRDEVLAQIVDDFNANNAWGITVQAEYQGSYGDIFNKMLTVLNTDDAPNLVVAYQNQAATYQLGESLTDMTSLVDSIKWGLTAAEKADFFQGFYKQDVFPTFGNARLGFPPNRSMEVLYYNMDWLNELGYDAAPTTPAEFEEIACAAVEQPYSGSLSETNMGYKLSIDASRLASWTFAFGGDVFDYEAGQYTYNSAAAVEAMTFLQGLFDSGCAELVTESYGDQTDFGQGGLLFTVGSSSGLPYYDAAVNDGGAAFAWSVAPIPHTTEEPVQNIYGASISMPLATPEEQLASWLFLKFYTTAEAQSTWAQASGYFPVRASVAQELEDAGYFEANPAYQTAFDMLQYGVGEPPTPGYDFVRTMAEEAMAAIADGADVVETLDQLNVDANADLAAQLSQ